MAKSPETLANPNAKIVELAKELEDYVDQQIDTWTPGEEQYPVLLGDPAHFAPLPVILRLLVPRYEAAGWTVELGQGADGRPTLTLVDPARTKRAEQLAARQAEAMRPEPFGK